MKITEKLTKKALCNRDEPAVTLAFLGDSVTQGCFELHEREGGGFTTVHDVPHTYHTYVARILNTLYPTVPVNIINAGIEGKSAVHALGRLERDVISHKPDLTVMCFGLNDSGNGDEGIPAYVSALDSIFTQLEAAGSEIIFMTPNMMNTNVSPNLHGEFFRGLAEGFAARQNAGGLKRYLDAAKELCVRRGVPVCDCYAKWEQLAANGVNVTELLSNLLNHPTREMHWLFAVSLVETMMQ